MNKSIISRAVMSALLLSTATVITAANMPSGVVTVKDNQVADVVTKMIIVTNDATDQELTSSATETKTPASPRVMSHFSFVQSGGNDTNSVVISNALANAFSTSTTIENGGISAKSIKNAPYRAEVVSENVQTLNDGNQIVKRDVQLSYRDSAGRTRIGVNDASGNIRSITVYDAVEKISYHINPKLKAVTKITTDPNFRKRIDQLREKARENNRDGKPTSISRKEILVSRIERASEADAKAVNEEIRVRVIPSLDGAQLGGKRTEVIRIDAASMNGASLGGPNQSLVGLG